MANWWQNNCVHLTLDTTLTISFLVSNISIEGSIKVKILVFFHAKPLPANYNIKCECFHSTYYIFIAVVRIIHIDGIVVFSVLFLWRKFVLFTNEFNFRYGYNLTIRKIAFVWYYESYMSRPLPVNTLFFPPWVDYILWLRVTQDLISIHSTIIVIQNARWYDTDHGMSQILIRLPNSNLLISTQ